MFPGNFYGNSSSKCKRRKTDGDVTTERFPISSFMFFFYDCRWFDASEMYLKQ